MTVEELLQDKDIYFRPAGKDVLVYCFSPEHEDSNASTRIDRLTGVYHCLSCGNKGNFFEDCNELRDHKSEKVLAIRKTIQDIMTATKGLSIPVGAVPFCREYRGIKASVYKELEAFTCNEFEDRLVFPVKDINGRIMAFSARHLYSDESPKYIISPSGSKLPIYPANAKPYLGSMILVEGIFDYINLKDKGVENVGCMFGTRTTSYKNIEEKFMPLLLAGTKIVYIMFDGDDAGRKAAEDLKVLIKTKTRLVVDIIELGEGADPGEMDQATVDVILDSIYSKGN